MLDVTYDPEADAVYICVGRGEIDHQRVADPFIYDVDTQGKVLGIEILSASTRLAPGAWQKARKPGETRFNAAE